MTNEYQAALERFNRFCLELDWSPALGTVQDTIRRALQAGAEGRIVEWQPIETAPEYIDDLLLSGVAIASSGEDTYVCTGFPTVDGFYTYQGILLSQPTHWAHLPPPPKENA